MWEGYGWMRHQGQTGYGWLRADEPNTIRLPRVPRPKAPADPNGEEARVQLPWRAYFLFSGPIEAVTAFVTDGTDQTPNLWWPSDRAWCVATEIDLSSTYVGGSRAMIERLLTDKRIEALPADPGARLGETESWIGTLAQESAATLMATGEVTITTSAGTLRAHLRRPSAFKRGVLETTTTSMGQRGSGTAMLSSRDEADLWEEVTLRLSLDLVSLVEGA